VGEADDGLGGADRSHGIPAGEAGSDVLDDDLQLLAVAGELSPGLAQRERQAPDLGLADGLLAAGISGELTVSQRGQGRAGQGFAGGLAVAVIAGQQQGTQPVGLGGGATVISWRATSKMRSASRSPSPRGRGSRPASRRSAASTARWASIGSDLPFPRRCLRLGCSHSITTRPAAANARASPIP
jgi:hypothetical protein